MPALPPPSLKARALRFLSAREHSRPELRRKLQRHAEDADEIERVLDELESRGWLSAARFVESVVHRKADRYGAERIRQELRQHGMADAATAAAVAALRDTEADRARALWERRFGEPATTPQERARQARFLIGRGFDPGLVSRLVNGRLESGREADLATGSDTSLSGLDDGRDEPGLNT